ncbi:hypothetical protein M8J76_006386 [Diaphorina citri]|nr:hypothetical protein M8J76_006386 [Diaphorina citri]
MYKSKMRPTSRSDKLLVRDVNPHLLCVLCRGYFVEATSIVECLHSFCKSCIVKYIKTSRYCPICDVQLNRQDPFLSLKPDEILQRLCYKIVPGLYKSEKLRRKDFSVRHNEAIASEFSATYNQYFSYEDNISISLEYYDNNSHSLKDNEIKRDAWIGPDKEKTLRKYLQCPAAVTINHLKKIVRLKYGLPNTQRVDILYNDERLEDDFKLMDVAYTFEWSRVEPMRFGYLIFKQYSITVKEPNKVTVVNISSAHQKNDNSPREGKISPKTNSPNFNNNQLTTKDKYYSANAPKRKFDNSTEENNVEPVHKICKQTEVSKDINENIDNSKTVEVKEMERVVDFEEEMEEEEDYSKYEQDIEEVTDDDASDKLRISSAASEDDATEQNSASPERKTLEEKSMTKSHYYYDEEYKPKKKSKKEKRHHHHHHHRHYDRKKPLEATILHSDDTNDLKLKVKLNVGKSSYYSYKKSKSSDSGSSPKQVPSDDDSNSIKSHRSDDSKTSRERKHTSSPQNKTVTHSQNGDNSGGEEKSSIPPSTKEKLLQMRAVRHKPISKEPKQTAEDRTTLLLAQSSITVSKITASEKIQLEKNKLNMSENEKPSLEIMLVKGPTPKSLSDLNKPGNVNAGLDLQRVPNGTSNSLLSKINKISSELRSENNSSKTSPVRRPSAAKIEKTNEEKSAEREAKLLDYVGALDLSRRPPNMPFPTVTVNEKTLQNGTWIQKQMNGKRSASNSPTSFPKTDVSKNMVSSKPISYSVSSNSTSNDMKTSLVNPAKKISISIGNNTHKKPVQTAYVPYNSTSHNIEKTVIPQPVKIPPTSNIPHKLLTNKNIPKTNEIVSNVPVRKNGITTDAHTKPGINQTVRHIPNPSALFFRNHTTVPNNHIEKKFKNGIPPIPAAIPISALTSMRRIENITKTLDKGANALALKSEPEF